MEEVLKRFPDDDLEEVYRRFEEGLEKVCGRQNSGEKISNKV